MFSGIVLCSACPVTEVAHLAVGNLDPRKHSSAATIVDLALLQRWKLMRETSWDKPPIPSASRQVSRHPLHASAFYTLGQPPVWGPLAFDQARSLAEQANTMPYAVLCLHVALGRCGGAAQSCSRCSQVRWNRQQCHQACALHLTFTTQWGLSRAALTNQALSPQPSALLSVDTAAHPAARTTCPVLQAQPAQPAAAHQTPASMVTPAQPRPGRTPAHRAHPVQRGRTQQAAQQQGPHKAAAASVGGTATAPTSVAAPSEGDELRQKYGIVQLPNSKPQCFVAGCQRGVAKFVTKKLPSAREPLACSVHFQEIAQCMQVPVARIKSMPWCLCSAACA